LLHGRFRGESDAEQDRPNLERFQPSADLGCTAAAVAVEDARASLPPDVSDYIDGGAGDEVTLRANREDL
jgi:hypothetical protein